MNAPIHIDEVDEPLKQVIKNICKKPNGKEWKKNPNACCWYDAEFFSGRACPLPRKYDERKKRWIVDPRIQFCSLNCARAFNRNRNRADTSLIDHYICKLGKSIFNDPLLHIVHAGDRCTLKRFGGSIEIDDWRARHSQGFSAEMKFPPFVAETYTIRTVKPRKTGKHITHSMLLEAQTRKRKRLLEEKGSNPQTALLKELGI